MLLTCYHHSQPFTHYSHSFSSSTTHSLFTIIPLRPLHLNTPILNLKPLSTPHRFTSYTVHTNSFHHRSNHVAIDSTNFDSFLSFLELSSLLSSLIVSATVAVTAIWKKELYAAISNRVAPWSLLFLVVGVLTGALIRRRKWRETVLNGGFSVSEVDFLQRVEKLEEDLKSNATVVRVLSRQLEKLGIRFRITRKGLKEPITEHLVAWNRKMDEEEHEVYGGEIPDVAEMEGDVDMSAADDEAGGIKELDEMRRRLKEMEDEAAALREMHAKVEKEIGSVQDPAAVAASQENKEEADARSVFVGNVDYACTPEEVQQHFQSCGTVNRVTILTDTFGQPKGFAYVEFVETEAVQEALLLTESELHGRQLKVLPKRTNVPGMKQYRPRRFNPYMAYGFRRP